MALYDEDGNKIEGALSPEEAEKKLKEERKKAEEERQKELDELKKESNKSLEALSSQLEEKEQQLDKLENKNTNFKKLRKSKEETEKEKEEEIEVLKKKISDIEKKTSKKLDNISEKIVENTRKDALEQLVGDDKDLRKKVKEQYDDFKGKPMSKGAVRDRVKKSYILATGSTPPKEIEGGHISTGNGDIPEKSDEDLSSGGKDLAKKFGLSDQDLDKYGKK